MLTDSWEGMGVSGGSAQVDRRCALALGTDVGRAPGSIVVLNATDLGDVLVIAVVGRGTGRPILSAGYAGVGIPGLL